MEVGAFIKSEMIIHASIYQVKDEQKKQKSSKETSKNAKKKKICIYIIKTHEIKMGL